MLRIYSKKADVGIHQQLEFETIVSHLQTLGYDSLIRNMVENCYQTAKLNPPNKTVLADILKTDSRKNIHIVEDNVGGEIFFKDDSLYVAFPSYNDTVLSLIGYENELSSLDQFCSDFQKSVEQTFDGRRIRSAKFNWAFVSLTSRTEPRSYEYESDYIGNYFSSSSESQKFEKPHYSKEDTTASYLLCDSKLRTFLMKLSKYYKMSEKDAESELDDKSQIETLIKNNLISKEFLIRCRQDQRVLCTVSTLETLQNDSTSNVKCGVCRRSFSEEYTQEIFTISEMGRNLINGSKWMSIWVTDQLIEHGINSDTIDWKIEENGEEIDIRISDFNSKVLLELKDREFGGGDTHPFIYRVDKYRGNIGAILTTQKIALEAKTILQEQQRKLRYKVLMMEGIDGIERGLKKMVRDTSFIQIRRHLNPLSALYGSITPVVNSWAIRKIMNIPPTEFSTSVSQSITDFEKLKEQSSLDN